MGTVIDQINRLEEGEFFIFFPYKGKRNTLFMTGTTEGMKRGQIWEIYDDENDVVYNLKIKLVRKKEVWADLIAN